MNDPRVKAVCKKSRQNKQSIFLISHNNHELPKRSITSFNITNLETIEISIKIQQKRI